MKNILSIDGWYFKVFSKLANLVLLNLIFVVSMIPIVTSGIAMIAFIKSLNDLRSDGSLSPLSVYTYHFKKNILKGMTLLLVMSGGLLIPSALIFISLQYIPLLSTFIMIIFSFFLLLLSIFPFAYSLNDYSIKEAFHQTLVFVTLKIAYAIAVFIVPVIIFYLSIKYSIVMLFLIGLSLIIYSQLYFINKAGGISVS